MARLATTTVTRTRRVSVCFVSGGTPCLLSGCCTPRDTSWRLYLSSFFLSYTLWLHSSLQRLHLSPQTLHPSLCLRTTSWRIMYPGRQTSKSVILLLKKIAESGFLIILLDPFWLNVKSCWAFALVLPSFLSLELAKTKCLMHSNFKERIGWFEAYVSSFSLNEKRLERKSVHLLSNEKCLFSETFQPFSTTHSYRCLRYPGEEFLIFIAKNW